jgi:hypothetical protein
MRTLLLLCVSAVVLSGGAAAARSGTGLYGRVVISPAYPVCEIGTPCTKPAGGLLLRFSRGGRQVETIRTHRNGTYLVVLRPGVYTISTPTVQSRSRGLEPRKATVPPARYQRINFTLDVGIR